MPIDHLKLGPEREGRLTAWLDWWLEQVEQRVNARSASWVRWRQMYEGKVLPKTFPWPNASNVFVPITGTHTDSIHSNMMNRIYGFDRVWDVRATKPGQVVGMDSETNQPITWTTLADRSQDFLQFFAGDNGPMQAYDAIEGGLLECLKLGTVVWFNPWMTLTQPDYAYDPESGKVSRRKEERIVFDGPKPVNLPLEDFVILPGYHQIHGPHASPLVGHYEWLRRGQVFLYGENGWFLKDRVAEMINSPSSDQQASEQVKDSQDIAEGDSVLTSQSRQDDFKIFNGWVEFDIDEDGLEESLYISYYRPTQTLLRVQPYIYKTRPYTVARYITRENRFYGIGVPELLDALQAAINTSYNQTIDNATLANTRWFKIRRGTFAAKSFDTIYPQKKVYVDNMEDIQGDQLGEIYPSSFEIQRSLQLHAERRTGINDFNLGNDAQAKMPATSAMALLQESSRRFDHYAKDIRRALGELGMQTLELIQQFKPTGLIYSVMGDKGEMVEKTLTLPTYINLREHFLVITTSSVTSSNKEISRQNAITGFGILSQYLEKIFALAQVITNPMAPPGLQKMAYKVSEVGERLMAKVLDGFDLQDIAAFLPQLDQIYADSQAQAGGAGPGGMGGPPGMVPGGGVPGMVGPGGVGGPSGGPGVAGPPPPGAGVPPPPRGGFPGGVPSRRRR